MKKYITYLSFLLVLIACGEPDARRPLTKSSGTFFKESVARNQKILEKEQQMFMQVFKRDSISNYIASESGFWYVYQVKDSLSELSPITDDVVTLQYELRDLNNRVIYSKEEVGTVKYKVDKENILTQGLREGVKLMKAGETATFYLPSSLAYGYHGDDQRVGVNVPLIATVSLKEITKQKP
ncbi:gliding motility-associated peptidyl-prolyl isomerase GldI [Sungkyunkwania multivorans]|uniref:Peptidyl-prolyl cis-trans isomerase n=1 Tax=Sungkyunkwania multivorans TaxID=1173618 RepID=A0ABW3CVY1_9FLAO